MTGLRPLSHLLTAADGNSVIALRGDALLSLDRFRADVAGCMVRLPKTARRVALVCDGSYAFAVGLFALLHANRAIVVPANGQAGTLAQLRDSFDLLVDDRFVRAASATSADVTPIEAADTALVFFTSGSTGAPQPVHKTLAMLEREAHTLESLWPSSAEPGPVYSTVPHQHIYGLMFKLVWPLVSGRAFRDETDELWETLLSALRPGATIVSGPAHLSRLSGLSPLDPMLRPVRLLSAGAPLSAAAARDAQAILGQLPTEIFGSTETGAIAWRQPSGADDAWRPLPGIDVRRNEDGRLSLRSPFVSDDWFDTADLIERQGDGFVLNGRADRIVKIEGKRVSLPAVEQALGALPWIVAAAAVVLPGTPARLAAAVVLNDVGHAQLQDVGSFRFGRLLRARLSPTQEAAGQPRVWRFVSELPSHGGLAKRRDADILALFEDAP